MVENTEGVIKNGHSRETGNIVYTRRRKTQHNMCWTPLYANKHKEDMSPPTNNWRYRQTEHRFYAEIVTDTTI